MYQQFSNYYQIQHNTNIL